MQKLLLILFSITIIFLSGCQKELFRGLSQNDANEMHTILANAGIESEKIPAKKGDLFILSVTSSDFSKALVILNDRGYPKPVVIALGDCKSLVCSPAEIKMKEILILSQNLEKTLLQIDGVLTAAVNIVQPEKQAFDTTTKPSSASILIKHHPSVDLSNKKVDIKILVEKSIEGLDYSNVSLFMLPAEKIQGSLSTQSNDEIHTIFNKYYLLVSVVLLLLSIIFWFVLFKRAKPLINIRKTNS